MIRQFRSQDASSCCELIRECVAKDSSISHGLRQKLCGSESPESMHERARLFYVTVFESEEEIEGVAGLDLNEIRLLCVRPRHQRRGTGRALVEHLRTMVPDILFRDMFVYSSPRAVGFYRACGFHERGQVSFNVLGEPMATVFMSLPLV
ncbi:MAG: GNAT family N-acetyltransferase [Acidobacteria bacterium]|nr:GNAT family N-acetyltransferase [Acidobacteriota bacterium]